MSSAAATDPASFIAGSKLKISWFKLAKKLSWTSESFLSMFKAQSPAITQKSSLGFHAAILVVDRALDSTSFSFPDCGRCDDLSHNSLSPTFKRAKRPQNVARVQTIKIFWLVLWLVNQGLISSARRLPKRSGVFFAQKVDIAQCE